MEPISIGAALSVMVVLVRGVCWISKYTKENDYSNAVAKTQDLLQKINELSTRTQELGMPQDEWDRILERLKEPIARANEHCKERKKMGWSAIMLKIIRRHLKKGYKELDLYVSRVNFDGSLNTYLENLEKRKAFEGSQVHPTEFAFPPAFEGAGGVDIETAVIERTDDDDFDLPSLATSSTPVRSAASQGSRRAASQSGTFLPHNGKQLYQSMAASGSPTDPGHIETVLSAVPDDHLRRLLRGIITLASNPRSKMFRKVQYEGEDVAACFTALQDALETVHGILLVQQLTDATNEPTIRNSTSGSGAWHYPTISSSPSAAEKFDTLEALEQCENVDG
ncbi:hypothetical protein CALCODRAFT_512069 [Calocera cornea HHB12733]|uniref:Uncharacterized protein n=1 Tax=Calocera cornea HHB12733 TaxID=1353952 RepID=A0A165DBD4_9BASI|nr:hypothetical protein CALCODRAFT_512069 [Calocera cornea HHB12733]